MGPQHVPLAVRKAVLARLIFHESVEPVLSSTTDETAFVVSREVRASLYGRTLAEIESALDSTPLDAFVSHAVGRAAEDILQNERAASNHSLRAAAAAMQERASGLSCSTCAGGHPVCDGSIRDNELVARGGRCISSFRVLYECAVGITRAYYQYALGAEILHRWPDTVLHTAFTPQGTPAHPYPSAAQISGAARRNGNQATLELIFSPEQFDWAAYLATGYVLVHEALHVMEGLDDPLGRMPASAEDSFVEGWMDWIAFELFDRTARGVGAAAALSDRLAFREGQRERARELHAARFDPQSAMPAHERLAYRLLSGKRAAERFHDFCRRYLRSEPAWRFFLRVSFLANARALDLTTHWRMVARVNELLPPAGARLARPLDEKACDLGNLIRRQDAAGAVVWLLEDDGTEDAIKIHLTNE